jgi:hypothetical protein
LLQKLKYVSVLPYMVDGDDTLKVADAWPMSILTRL